MSAVTEQIASREACDATETVSELRQAIEDIRSADEVAEQKKRKGTILIVVGILLAIGGLIIGAMAEMVAVTIGGIGLGAGSLVVGIVIRAAVKGDYDNHRFELADRLLGLLGSDMAPDSPVHLRMDLSKTDAKTKFVGESTAGRWKVKQFQDPWLGLGGRLLDGTRFRIGVTDHHQNRSCWKTSRSGKRKHKTKTKAGVEVRVDLKVKEARYPGLGSLAEDPGAAVQLPEWALVKGIDVADGSLSIRAAAKGGVTAADFDTDQLVANMLLSLYQVLNLTRAVKKVSE